MCVKKFLSFQYLNFRFNEKEAVIKNGKINQIWWATSFKLHSCFHATHQAPISLHLLVSVWIFLMPGFIFEGFKMKEWFQNFRKRCIRILSSSLAISFFWQRKSKTFNGFDGQSCQMTTILRWTVQEFFILCEFKQCKIIFKELIISFLDSGSMKNGENHH